MLTAVCPMSCVTDKLKHKTNKTPSSLVVEFKSVQEMFTFLASNVQMAAHPS